MAEWLYGPESIRDGCLLKKQQKCSNLVGDLNIIWEQTKSIYTIQYGSIVEFKKQAKLNRNTSWKSSRPIWHFKGDKVCSKQIWVSYKMCFKAWRTDWGVGIGGLENSRIWTFKKNLFYYSSFNIDKDTHWRTKWLLFIKTRNLWYWTLTLHL